MKKTLIIHPDKEFENCGFRLIDPETGEILMTCFSSNAGFARGDLHDRHPKDLKRWKEKYGMETEAIFLSETDKYCFKNIYNKLNLEDRLRLARQDKEFTKNNRLIADFIFRERDKVGDYLLKDGDYIPQVYSIAHKLRFHEDWNMLMTAIEFIENKGYRVEMGKTSCIITGDDITCMNMDEYKIEAVYNTIVQFIKGYNNGK